MLLVSFSDIFLGFITITPGKALFLEDLAISQPSDGFITGSRVSCLISLWPIFLGPDSGLAYSRLLFEYCSG
jgi:hypothetical protein